MQFRQCSEKILHRVWVDEDGDLRFDQIESQEDYEQICDKSERPSVLIHGRLLATDT